MLCALVIGLCNANFYCPASAAEYNIKSFDELVNNSASYQSGDLINTIQDITAAKNIGDIFPSGGEFTLNGQNNKFLGNNKKGFTVNKNTHLTVNEFSSFENFNSNGNGGAFENNGTLTVNNTNFSNNVAAKGSAIFNKGTLNINNGKFTNNGSTSNTTFGGAIRSEAGTLNISNSTFTDNVSKTYGGAIATSNTIINITDSSFYNNKTDGRGGVLSSNAYTTIRNSEFKYNSSKSYGGALNINNDVYINNSIFEGNYTEDSSTRVNGGAIRAESGNVLINNSTFKGNSASWGGAISSENTVTLSIINSIFDGNTSGISSNPSALSSGGAITNGNRLTILNSAIINNTAQKNGGGINFNGSVLNISANGDTLGQNNGYNRGDTLFEGNKLADGTSSGLHVYQGYDKAPVVNLNAGNGGSVTFNDAIMVGDDKAAGNGSIEFNINKDIKYNDLAGHDYTIPSNGRVIFNNSVGGITESIINLYDGYLVIGENGSFNNVSMNLNGGVLETRNGVSNNLDFNDLNINKDTNWRMDVDLASNTSDYLNISGNVSSAKDAVLTIETIRLISDFGESDRVVGNTKEIYFSNQTLNGSPIASLAYDQTILTYVTTNSTYSVGTNVGDRGSKLDFTYEGTGGLPFAVAKDGIRIYSGTGDEKITAWENNNNNVQGDKLIIWGNDYSVTNESGGVLKGLAVGTEGKNQTFEINDVNEWSGFSDSYVQSVSSNDYYHGGAFAIVGGSGNTSTLNIDNVNFIKNNVGTLTNSYVRSYGGAISITNSSSSAFANILNSDFTENSVVGEDAYGGAISISLGNLDLVNSKFEENTASSTSKHAYGGAIFLTHNDSKLILEDVGFSSNKATSFTSPGGYQMASGGAIAVSTNGSHAYLKNNSFVGNIAEGYRAYGGAINNVGFMTIIDSAFMYNKAVATGTAQGGAIVNSGTLNLVADENTTLFTRNYIEKVKKEKDGTFTTVSTESQGLYNTGTVNMNASEEQSVVFHDKIDGTNKGVININKNGITYTDYRNNFTAPVLGNVIFNNSVSNQTINLYNGTLSIGKDTKTLDSGDKYFNNVSLNGYGGTFDLTNNQIDKITLDNFNIINNTNLTIDVDLANKQSDFITVNNAVTGSGSLVIDTVKIITDMKAGVNSVKTQFINQNLAHSIISEASKTVSTNDYIYNVSLSDNNTTLVFERAKASLGLPEAVAKPDITEFNMTRDELVAEWIEPTLNNLQGDLTIVGNMHSIIAQDNLDGMITDGHTLNIIEAGDLNSENVLDESMRNFNVAITNNNNGTVNLTHSVFTKNIAKNQYIDLDPPFATTPEGEDITTQFVGGNGAVVKNESGTVNINGGIFAHNNAEHYGGAIYNNGELNLIASEGNRVIFYDNHAMTSETLNKYSNDIYQTADGKTFIEGTGGMIYFGGGFAGEGQVEKFGTNEMILGTTSDSSKFTGEFLLTQGTLTVQDGAEFFGGTTEITDGILNWDTSTSLADSAKIVVTGGEVNVLSHGHLVLNDNVNIGFVRHADVAIQEGGILENTKDLTIFGNEIHGYDDGKGKTYGTFKNTGNLTINGDNSQFKGTFLQTEGTTIAIKDSKMFSNGDLQGGSIIFTDNATISSDGTFTSANSDGEKTLILNNSTNSSSIIGVIADSTNKNLNIIISNDSAITQTTKIDQINLNEDIVSLTLKDNVIFDGDINVGNNATLSIIADKYDIAFNNSITDINGSSKFNIETSSGRKITLDGNSVISGNANIDDGGIIKSGAGTLIINGDTAKYTGNFTQHEGKTEVSTNGFLFNGTKNILGGELLVNSNTGIYYNDLNLHDNTKLTHKSSIPTGGEIKADTFTFKGSNATAAFGSVDGLASKVEYTLGADIYNENTNTISFTNSKVTLGTDDYTGNTVYEFKDSKINLGNSHSDIKDYVFNKLNSENTSLDLEVNFVNDGSDTYLATDTLNILNTDVVGGNVFELGNIVIHDASLENGSPVYNTVKDVLQGDNATFKNQEATNLVAEGATTIYEYKLSLTDTKKSIKLESVGPADENSLNKINVKDINRFFNFSKGKEGAPEYYYNAASLDATGKGNFAVSGATDNAADSILSGFLMARDDDGNPYVTDVKGSLFNMADETTFTLQNLTVENTYKDGEGSVISIGTPDLANNLANATVENVIIRNTQSTGDGGAIYNNGGTISFNTAVFTSNNSGAFGGAIKNESGTVHIFNSQFGKEGEANTAQNGAAIATGATSDTDISFSSFSNNISTQNGGAIHNKGNLNIIESVSAANNTATNGRGGAIYNEGNLTISSKTSSDVLFDNNKDSVGLNDIYQTSGSTITINGEGGKVGINSGFAGEGAILKEGINELVLGEKSKNSNFTGTFTQTEGFTSVYGEFFGGTSEIAGGTLNWNTTTDKVNTSILTANAGIINLNGKLTLNNANDSINNGIQLNINANSILNVEKGYASLDRNGNDGDFANYDKWEGAITQSGGTIDYNLDKNGLLQASKGTINIKGGNLTLEDVKINDKTYTSTIAKEVNLNIENNSTLTLNSANTNLTLNTGDVWSENGTINLKNGTLNYTDNIGNGKILAEKGNLNIINGTLALNDSNDVIGKSVNVYIDKSSILEVNEGKVTLNSDDRSSGILKLNDNGSIVMDSFTNNQNHAGTRYQQTGGTLTVNNNSNMSVISSGSFIRGGNVVVDNSILSVGSAPSELSMDNMTLKNNAIFNTAQEFIIENNLNMSNSYLNGINNNIDSNHIGNLIVSSGTTANFGIDINPRAYDADKFLIGSIDTDAYKGGLVNVNNFNFVGGCPIDRELSFQIFNAAEISEKILFGATDNPLMTPIGNYKLFSHGGGMYGLRLVDYNPQVFRGQVATMASYQNQLMIDNIVLDHIMLVSQEIIASEGQNKYAATLPQFAPYQYSQADGGVWVKNYVNFETLDMTQNLNVGNNSYGTLVGLDMPLVKMKKGWKFIPTAYIGYNGANQNFNSANMYQNGGQGGFMGTFIKQDFIGSIMGYAGGYNNEMQAGGFTDNTGNWFAGTAAKLAYNFHPTRNLIIQPTAFASYNIFGKQNCNSQFGILGMNSGLLNGINVAPGLNIIYGRENWSLYATFQYMYNINDNISGKVGNVDLPSIKMDHGYIEYGIGATRKWKDHFNSYVQVTLRNGGRTGIGFQLGAQYLFDINELKKSKKSQITPQPPVKKVIKTIKKI